MLRSIPVLRPTAAAVSSGAACRFYSSSTGTSSTVDSSTISTSSTSSSGDPSSSSSSATSASTSSSSSSTRPSTFRADPNFHPPPHPRRPRSRLSHTLFILGWIPVAAFVTSHIYSLGNVTGYSMSPTFNGAPSSSSRSDVVLLNRTVKYSHSELRVGDIVTLISPLDPRLLLTKRIIALPGDSVRVWMMGRGWVRMKVAPGHVWVEGDAAVDIIPGSLERVANPSSQVAAGLRNKSRDSREFGPVPMGLITSRIEAILWPPERFGSPAPRPAPTNGQGQYPPSTTGERSTQVNPSLARILDEMTQMDKKGWGKKAHPEDSVISPYVDWDDPHAQDDADEVGARTKVGEDDDDRKRKNAWNRVSRGGRLGDHAD